MGSAAADYIRVAKRAQRQAATDDLVGRHLWLAAYLAWQYRHRGVLLEDLIGVANLALVEAARAYPASQAKRHGKPFSAYATVAIRRACQDAIRQGLPVAVTPYGYAAMSAYTDAKERLEWRQGTATDEDLAKELGWTVDEVQAIRERAKRMLPAASLDEPVPGFEDEERSWLDDHADPTVDVEAEALSRIEAEEKRAQARALIERLPSGLRATLSLRFGIPAAGVETLSMDDALRVLRGWSSNTHWAILRLREAVAR